MLSWDSRPSLPGCGERGAVKQVLPRPRDEASEEARLHPSLPASPVPLLCLAPV